MLRERFTLAVCQRTQLPKSSTTSSTSSAEFVKFGSLVVLQVLPLSNLRTRATRKTQCDHWTEHEFAVLKRALSYQRAVLAATAMTGAVVVAADTEAAVVAAAVTVAVEGTATIQDLVRVLARRTSVAEEEEEAVLARVPVEEWEGSTISRRSCDERMRFQPLAISNLFHVFGIILS